MTKKVDLTSKATSKTIRRSLIALCIAGSSFGVNAASLTGNVSLTSDYLFRGISQTDAGPAVQGGFTLSSDSGFYLSTWGSSIKFGEGSMELDLMGGWSGALNDSWNVDVGVMQYRYPKGDNAVDEFNFYEGYAKFFYDSWTFGVAYSPDYFGAGVDDYYYLSADYSYSLAENISLDLHFGYNVFENESEFETFLATGPVDTDTYIDWSIGFSTEVLGAGISLKYADTDIDGSAACDLCEEQVVLTLSKSF